MGTTRHQQAVSRHQQSALKQVSKTGLLIKRVSGKLTDKAVCCPYPSTFLYGVDQEQCRAKICMAEWAAASSLWGFRTGHFHSVTKLWLMQLSVEIPIQ